jgi:PAS domain-containing protein
MPIASGRSAFSLEEASAIPSGFPHDLIVDASTQNWLTGGTLNYSSIRRPPVANIRHKLRIPPYNPGMAEWRAQPEVERFRRLYVGSTQVNHALARSRSRKELLEEVVRVLVESAGFAMAFIAWHDPVSHELKPVARFGDTGHYLDRIKIFADESAEGQNPSGTAFRTRAPYYCNDFLNDPHTFFWRDAAHASGWRASAAIPIVIGGEPRGLLAVYSRESGFFGPKEAELLEAVATDLAFGLEHLDAEAQRREAVSALAANERRLKLAVDAGGIGTFEWDLSTGKVVLDGRLEQLFGFDLQLGS